ncbi:MAG: ClpXP protease specificity-enhancing factor SspB [Pseudomonadota bacterium]
MTDYIGYEKLTRAAMRGVVRNVLEQTVDAGSLQGEHHFYISFRTKSPGVKVADHLIERFPEEMTIVIQHQYWDLEVGDDHFEIILKFSGVPQHLHIPFLAITRFVDPSVNFALAFDKDEIGEAANLLAPLAEGAKVPHQDKVSSDDDSGTVGTVVNIDAFRRK